MKNGDRVILVKPLRGFPVGHVFTVIGSSYRGLDLIDDEGHAIYETLFVSDHYKEYTIDKIRDDKIDIIIKQP